MNTIDDIQDHNDDTNRCCNGHHRDGTDVNSPAVLALVIVNETSL
jgi:hypothetical protein